ncbi:uncharacterized protein LOC122092421 [Macadamia integrifolia]|uniref:uncharacterized protein LOC122092421 n=1 Tax=Macadamia integrifolia TaxID=60698 RepID=UPI001C52E800|nr:uncharacterized protein LOC122092421 [Macadamia integrifolia]
MVQGPASQKNRFWVDEKGRRGQLNNLDGLQISLSSSFNGNEEIAKGFEGSEANFKRIKLMGSHQQVEVKNVLEESSPLGLTLRKTPSFLDLIEMKLSRGRNLSRGDVDFNMGKVKSEDFSAQPIAEKLKASNFPANLLRIGTWERVSIHKGDLVAKCYYAKHKLVWEVLECGLKSKIEIQWSDISAIRAIFQDNEADILEIELSRAPMFFRETDPQPRKHTLWQTTSDFTGGQAPIYRQHYVQFPGGTFEKHYEKLLQCDKRLFMLSKKPFPTQNSPYFYSNLYEYPAFSFGFNGYQPSSHFPHLSVPSSNAMPLQQLRNFETIKLSLTVNDQNLCNREGEQVGELPLIASTRRDIQLPCGDDLVNNHPPPNNLLLNKIADHLLNDPFASVCSDEQRILAKVKSMCNLLDMSREPIPTGNLNKHLDIDMKCKAYGGQDYKTNNHNMLRNMEQSTGGSDSTKQGCNENTLMNLTRSPSSPYFSVDPVMEDAGCVYNHPTNGDKIRVMGL